MKKLNIVKFVLFVLASNISISLTLAAPFDEVIDEDFGSGERQLADTYAKGKSYDGKQLQDDITNGRTFPICEYVNSDDIVRVGIYNRYPTKEFDLNDTSMPYKKEVWSVVYRVKNSSELENLMVDDKAVSVGFYSDVFTNNKYIKQINSNNEGSFECSKYASYGKPTDEVTGRILCFHNNENLASECGSNFMQIGSTYTLEPKGTIYYQIQKYATTTEGMYKDLNNSNAYLSRNIDLYNLFEEQCIEHIEKSYNSEKKYNLPLCLYTFIRDPQNIYKNNTAFSTYVMQLNQKIEAAYDNNRITWEQKDKKLKQLDKDIELYYSVAGKNSFDDPSYPGGKDDFSTNCVDFAPTIRFGGYILFIIKVMLPLIIIIKASFNIFNTVTKGNAEELNKQVKKLAISCIASILIFFAPSTINVIFNMISGFSENMTSDSKICSSCIFNPFGKECVEAVERG